MKRRPAFLLDCDHAFVKQLAEADEKSITQTLHTLLVFIRVNGIESTVDLNRNYYLRKCIHEDCCETVQ